jgi:hypothetical protein
MSKLLRHKWKEITLLSLIRNKQQCQKCGTIRYWDFDYNCVMYRWGTHITYKAPDCILATDKPYNPIEIQAIKK